MSQQPKYYPIYFSPDIDPSWTINPGILIDVSDAIPTRRNTLKSYAASSAGDLTVLGTFSEATYGIPLWGQILKSVVSVSGITTVAESVIGTTKRLLSIQSSGPSFYDASKGGTDYSTATGWTFTTYGNDVIACSKANPPQKATLADGGMVFADLGGSPPKAKVCVTQKNFLMLGDCNDGVNDLGDQVWWSGLGNDATWTPSLATQAGNYRLLDTPGPVCALVNLRDTVIAYKEDSIYVGDYQGATLQWTWRVVSDRVGCSSPHGVAVVNGIHYFMHRSGLYRFDGASVMPIGAPISRYLASKITKQKLYGFVQAAHEESENCIYWFFGTNTDVDYVRSKALVWNYQSNTFGFISNAWAVSGSEGMRCVVPATLTDYGWSWSTTLAQATTNLTLLGTTDTAGGTAKLRFPSFGANASGAVLSITTGDIGDDYTSLLITRVKPRYLTPSSASSLTAYGKEYEGGTFDAGTTFTADTTRQRFDGSKKARWHKLVVGSSAAEIAGLMIVSQPGGTE